MHVHTHTLIQTVYIWFVFEQARKVGKITIFRPICLFKLRQSSSTTTMFVHLYPFCVHVSFLLADQQLYLHCQKTFHSKGLTTRVSFHQKMKNPRRAEKGRSIDQAKYFFCQFYNIATKNNIRVHMRAATWKGRARERSWMYATIKFYLLSLLVSSTLLSCHCYYKSFP